MSHPCQMLPPLRRHSHAPPRTTAVPLRGPAMQQAGTLRLCRVVSALVAAQAEVPVDVMLAHSRCRAPVAAARQLAMYVAHVGLGLPQRDVARGFLRDRTTVAHACRRVEDQRDDPAFDRHVAWLEACARWAVGQ